VIEILVMDKDICAGMYRRSENEMTGIADREGHQRARTAAGAIVEGVALNGERRRLQRIVKDPGRNVREVPGMDDPRSAYPSDERQKLATLSPQLVNPASATSEDSGVRYQCTECDMMVKDSDPYCPFCGAVFADGPLGSEDEVVEADDTVSEPEPIDSHEYVQPDKFDVLGMLRPKSRARDLLYREALNGFAGSARLLEELEDLISNLSSLGTDTTRARRLMGSAWEACREGNWTLVLALAKQTEDVMAPNIPALVRSELAKAREYLMQAKAAGADISGYVLRMKAAMHSLKADEIDEALRQTKELTDLLRGDSASWGKSGSPASGNSFQFDR